MRARLFIPFALAIPLAFVAATRAVEPAPYCVYLLGVRVTGMEAQTLWYSAPCETGRYEVYMTDTVLDPKMCAFISAGGNRPEPYIAGEPCEDLVIGPE